MEKTFSQEEMPHDLNAELAILGTMLSNETAAEEGLATLSPKDFFDAKHREIFLAMKSCAQKDRAVQILTVFEELTNVGLRNMFPTPERLVECIQAYYPGLDIESHIAIIKDKRAHRELIIASHLIFNTASRPIEDVSATLELCRKKLFDINNPSSDKEAMSLKEAAKECMRKMMERVAYYRETGKIKPVGVESGFPALDKIIGGLRPGNLIVVAARPGVGKTAFALNIAHEIGVNRKEGVAFFSLEMPKEELAIRLITIDSQIYSEKLSKGSLSEDDLSSVSETVERFDWSQIIIDDKSGIKINEIKNRARRLKESHNIKVVIIDYLQLISGSGTGRNYENRQTEVADISRSLKSMAKELDLPIICLAQLSRKTEERDSKKPILSDLRESGAIEQDSDSVIFLTRPDMTDPYQKPGIVEIYVSKNRHGPIDKFDLQFNGATSRFNNIVYNIEPAYQETDRE